MWQIIRTVKWKIRGEEKMCDKVVDIIEIEEKLCRGVL